MVQTRHEYWSPIIDKYSYSHWVPCMIPYITRMSNRVIEIKSVFMITLEHFKQIKSIK